MSKPHGRTAETYDDGDGRSRVVDAAAIESARSLKELHARRIDIMGRRLADEVAWNILIDLLVSEADGRRVSISALSSGSGAPLSTTLRYVALLSEHGYVARIVDRVDRRRSHAELTHRGREVVARLLRV